MKFKTMLAELSKEETPVQKIKIPTQNANILRSNIDQFWKNPDDLKSDLSLFLRNLRTSDHELYAITVHTINEVMSQNKVISKPNPPVQIQK